MENEIVDIVKAPPNILGEVYPARGQVPGMRVSGRQVRWQVGTWQQQLCMYTNRQRVDANASAFFVTPTGFNNVA
jgi:hypothetical protein